MSQGCPQLVLKPAQSFCLSGPHVFHLKTEGWTQSLRLLQTLKFGVRSSYAVLWTQIPGTQGTGFCMGVAGKDFLAVAWDLMIQGGQEECNHMSQAGAAIYRVWGRSEELRLERQAESRLARTYLIRETDSWIFTTIFLLPGLSSLLSLGIIHIVLARETGLLSGLNITHKAEFSKQYSMRVMCGPRNQDLQPLR